MCLGREIVVAGLPALPKNNYLKPSGWMFHWLDLFSACNSSWPAADALGHQLQDTK